ncbi:hypothetical protein CASFOL_014059 [Castilleja foliolosa]|uniref:Uncharacterized protein n=1 Tax=Castilleja foliolosa TaxID=1961234 RepID=A0ABD3DMX6_9LAMI
MKKVEKQGQLIKSCLSDFFAFPGEVSRLSTVETVSTTPTPKLSITNTSTDITTADSTSTDIPTPAATTHTVSRHVPWLPTVKTTTATTTSSTDSATTAVTTVDITSTSITTPASATHTVSRQVAWLPTFKTTSSPATTSAAATNAAANHTLSCQVPWLPTVITSLIDTAKDFTGTLPRHMPIATAIIAVSASAAAIVAIPCHMSVLPTIITRTAEATTTPISIPIAVVPPVTGPIPTPAIVAIITPLRSQIDGTTAWCGDVNSLTLTAIYEDGELNHLALTQCAIAVRFDGGLMNEQIFVTFIRLDEAVPFLIIKFGHYTLRPSYIFLSH